jgi:heme/copper-type cytochrome/quinol oxidase subunit 2
VSGNALRVVAGVVVIALAVLLYVVLSSSDDEETTSSAAMGVPVVVVEGGEPEGGVQELTYNSGEPIRFRVESDIADEVHFHGYDVGKDVAAGGIVSFEVPATIPGIFEVELEEAREQIAEVTVEP